MDAAADVVPAPFVDPNALVLFLDALRGVGYRVSTDQYIIAQDLVLVLAAQGAGADDPKRLKGMLGPLVCATPKEQADFGAHFDRWVDRLYPARRRDEAGQTSGGDDTGTPATKRGLEHELDSIQRSRRWLRGVASPIVVVVALVVTALYFALRKNEGTLLVHTTPDRAVVRLILPDSERAVDSTGKRVTDSVGVTPLRLERKRGSYTLGVTFPGYRDTTVIVSVLPRTSTDVDLKLRALGMGAVWFRTRPGGASVIIDTSTVGRTPLLATGGLRSDSVLEGVRRVQLVRRGFRHVDTTVTVRPGKLDSIDVPLGSARQFPLRIGSIPPGAAVTIDGRAHGVTPLPPLLMDEGPYQIGVSLPGYASATTTSDIVSDTTITVALARLIPLGVSSEPAGATVSIDGRPVGVTPVRLQVAEGAHDLLLAREDFEEFRRSVRLDRPDSLQARLVSVRRPRQRIAFNATGDTIWAGDPHDRIRAWNLADTARSVTGSFLASLPEPLPGDAVMSPDGSRTAVPNGKTVVVAIGPAGGVADTLEPQKDHVSTVAFSADGRFLASGDASGGLRVWAMKPQPAHTLDVYGARWTNRVSKWLGFAPTAMSESLSVSTGGNLVATTSASTGIQLWDVESGAFVDTLAPPAAVSRGDQVVISDDGRRVMRVPGDSTSPGRNRNARFSVLLWTLDSVRIVRQLSHDVPVKRAAMRPDGSQVATVDERGVFRLWDLDGSDPVAAGRVLPQDSSAASSWRDIRALRYSVSGRLLLAVNSSGDVYVWFTRDAARPPMVLSAGARSAVFTGDEILVVTTNDSGAHAWLPVRPDSFFVLDTTAVVANLGTGAAKSLAVTVSRQGSVLVRNMDADVAPKVLLPNGDQSGAAEFPKDAQLTSDGRWVLVTFGESRRVELRLVDGAGQTTLDLVHSGVVRAAAISSNGKHVVTESNGVVTIWNTNGITEMADVEAHAREVRGLVFSPDGKRLASAGADGAIRLWDTRTFAPLDSIPAPRLAASPDSGATRRAPNVPNELHDVAFSADGAQLAAVASSGIVRLYSTPGSRWRTIGLGLLHAWPVGLALLLLPVPWLIYRVLLRRRATSFIRKQSNEQPLIERITLRSIEDDVFPEPAIMRAATRLRRRVDLPSSELDVAATVTQTLRHGGVFTPAFLRLKVTPEYLALVDRTTLGDQQTAFVDELLDRLQRDQVLIERYYFDGDPRVCFPADPLGRPATLGTLTQQYDSHRVLLFSDARRCFDPVTGELARWTDLFRRWTDRAVLTPEVPARWGIAEETLGREIPVYHASATGLVDLVNEARPTMPNADASAQAGGSYPAMLQRRPARWTERDPLPTAEVDAMLTHLRAYLDDDGMTWLAACAVYPAVSWKLTLNLGHELRNGDGVPVLDADRLLRMSRLPWLRRGYMPDWLRLRLLDLLTPDQEAQVRRTLELLLLTAVAGDESTFDLEVANRHERAIHALAGPVLRYLRRKSRPSGPMRDYVFAEFMSPRRSERLAVRVARAVPAIATIGARADAGKPNASPNRKALGCVTGLLILFYGVKLLAYGAGMVNDAWRRIPESPAPVDTVPRAILDPSRVPADSTVTPRGSDTTVTAMPDTVVMGPTPDSAGTPFRDICAVPAAVSVRAGWWLNSVQLMCIAGAPRLQSLPQRGGDGGNANSFMFPSERVVAVSGSYGGEYGDFVFSLQVHTNRRSSPVYGNEGTSKGRHSFRFDIPAGRRFAGFVGRSGMARSSDGNMGNYLVSIGVVHVRDDAAAPPSDTVINRETKSRVDSVAPAVIRSLRLASITPANGTVNVPIDTRIRLRFSRLPAGDSIDATSLTNTVRVLTNGRPVPWSAAVSSDGVELAVRPLVEFNTRYTVAVLPGVRSVRGRQLAQPTTASFTTVFWDSLYYYRVTNAFLGPRQSLTAGPKCSMQVASGGNSADWFFVPVPQNDGFYFMQNAAGGRSAMLEGSAPPDVCFMLSFSGVVFSGITWKPVPATDRTRYYLKNANFDGTRSLTVSRENGTAVTMQPTAVDAAQLWSFTRSRRR